MLAGQAQKRFDKALLVVIGSELYGDSFAIARDVDAARVLAEMSYVPPVGTVVTVKFQDSAPERTNELVARAEVDQHLMIHGEDTRLVSLRFLDFIDQGEVPGDFVN